MRLAILLTLLAVSGCDGTHDFSDAGDSAAQSIELCVNDTTLSGVIFMAKERHYADGGADFRCSIAEGDRESHFQASWQTGPGSGGHGWCEVGSPILGTDGGTWTIQQISVAAAHAWSPSSYVNPGSASAMYATFARAGDPHDGQWVQLLCTTDPP